MSDTASRLKHMRKEAGYPSARSAALAMGVPVPTYLQHENGSRAISITQFDAYKIFLQTARLVERFKRRQDGIPDEEIVAALVYDGIHVARHWTEAAPQTMEAYRKGVRAVFASKGITLADTPVSPAQSRSKAAR